MTQSRGDSTRVVHPLFQVEEGGSIPTSPLQLHVETTPFPYARQLNELWHSRLPSIECGFIQNQPFLSFVAAYGGIAYAAAIWSNPVAANLPQQSCLELRRYAIAPDAPKNTASRVLAIMVRFIRKHRPEVDRLVSYQDSEVHAGTIYKASGWTATASHKGGSWSRPNLRNSTGTPRTRPDSNAATGPKVRWELEIPLSGGVEVDTQKQEICRDLKPGKNSVRPLPGSCGRQDDGPALSGPRRSDARPAHPS